MEQIITDTIDNGTIENVHLAPIGRFNGSDKDGNPVPENISKESLDRLAEKLNNSDEILMDIDHQSTKAGADKNTEALGWFSRFVVDPLKGLFATLKLTKKGKDILQNREYRYTSPTFLLDENGEPVDLHSVAATNLPAFKGFINPILNSEATLQDDNIDKKEKIEMEITKEDLVDLIKTTVLEMKAAEEKAEAIEEIKEETAEIENSCEQKQEEVKNEVVEEKKEEEVKAEEIPTENSCSKNEEACEECKKEEVIKIEALNTSAVPTLGAEPEWKQLHGEAFFKYINSGKYKQDYK